MILSPEQQKVIDHRGSDIQVIACAGSGKTESISRRVSEKQLTFDVFEPLNCEYVTWDNHVPFEKGMFVAKMRGNSMAPNIQEDVYCLFRLYQKGSCQNKIVLVHHNAIDDPATSGHYCVREYMSEKIDENGNTARIHLQASNPEARSFTFDVKEEQAVKVLAEYVISVG